MPVEKHPLGALQQYVPEGSYHLVLPLLEHYKVQLTVTLERQSKLGDYRRHGHRGSHRISVNGNLNRYAFLITLLHELAHLLVNEQHGWRVQPHGREWKQAYGQLLHDFLRQQLFPADIAAELQAILHNPGASSCTEDGLQRVLFNYDDNPHGLQLVESLKPGDKFVIKGGKVFVRGNRLRKRIQCTKIPEGHMYLFNPLYAVKPLP